ncbi:MAG: hypothetical protein ABJZ55_23935 [Fuerstiella sp.]
MFEMDVAVGFADFAEGFADVAEGFAKVAFSMLATFGFESASM